MSQVAVDGACSPNPGYGAWAIVFENGITRSGGEADSTNQRMELRAAIEALEMTIEGAKIEVISDSRYLIDGATKWMANWKKKNWKRKDKKHMVPVKNVDLWKQLDDLISVRDVTFTWVKGHTGHVLQEQADSIAEGLAEVGEVPSYEWV